MGSSSPSPPLPSLRDGHTHKRVSWFLGRCFTLRPYLWLCCFLYLVSGQNTIFNFGAEEGREARTLGFRLTGFVLIVVIAETSLYIPGFEEQPVSVAVVGVDSDGRTTWQIVPSKPTGTISPASFSLTGKFVLSLSSFTSTRSVHPFPSRMGVFVAYSEDHRINDG